jgi:cell division protein FtsW
MKVAVGILVFCVAGLLALGLIVMYSSSADRFGAHLLAVQFISCVVGLVGCGLAASIDYGHLRKCGFDALGVSLVLLGLVLIPGIGTEAGGAHRWLSYRGFRLQPSELAKLSLIIVLAWYGERYQRQMHTWSKGLAIPICLFVVPVLALVFPEPDRGSTILLAALSGTLLLIAGVRWGCLVPVGIMGCAGLGYSLLHDSMRMNRVMSWLYPEQAKQGVGHQVYQAKLALGAGGWTGLGLGNGKQKLGFVPEHHTDFILSVIGEELGFVASILVVVAFAALFICGLYIAWRARDTFGMLLGAGLSFMIGLQAMINIGVVTGVFPNKGLPLPFISYGGSNLVIMLTSVGLLLSIARHSADPASVEPGKETDVR